MRWLTRKQPTPTLESEREVERVYRTRYTAPKLFVGLAIAFMALAFVLALLTAYAPHVDADIGAALCGAISVMWLAISAVMSKAPFLFRERVVAVRVKGRVLTAQRYWKRFSEIWLGDASRLVWALRNGPVRVHLISHAGDFMFPLAPLGRADCVELIEWLRWGVEVSDEFWPEFCFRFALPRRGPIDRPLREWERRRTRRLWDKIMACVALVVAVSGGAALVWTGQLRWLTPLVMVASLWTWRFTIRREGEIVVRSPLCPKLPRMALGCAALLAGLAIAAPLASGPTGELLTGWAAVLAMVLGMSAAAVVVGMYMEQKQYVHAQQPRWIEQATIAWNAEAKSGAWSLGRTPAT